MKKIVVASTHKEAGKTSLIIGLSKILEGKGLSIGYMKPIGDRLLYQNKRLWDFDAALVTNVLNLTESPENIGYLYRPFHGKPAFLLSWLLIVFC